MRCSWCGGEILEPLEYEEPSVKNPLIENICLDMRNHYFCSPVCLKRNLQTVVLDLQTTHTRIKVC